MMRTICVAVALVASSVSWHTPPAVNALRTAATSTPPAGVASDRAVFRLGNAASPFESSTVIGDFNTDGRPDVAVADHIARGANGYAYRLEVSIAGEAPRDVTFESTHEALTVRVADVDRDSDLDLIVQTPLSGETIAVWVNDGHGHFTAGHLNSTRAVIEPLPSADGSDENFQPAAFNVSSRRADDALTTALVGTISISTCDWVRVRPHTVYETVASSTNASRAPPTASLLRLS